MKNTGRSLETYLKRYVGWLKNLEITVLFTLLCLVAGSWVFIEIADEIRETDQLHFDTILLDYIRATSAAGEIKGPDWLPASMEEITALGGITIICVAATITIIFLLVLGRYQTAMVMFCSSFGGIGLSFALKYLFARPRPDESLHMVMTETFSFPSGHAMSSAVVYLSLAGLLAKVQRQRNVKIFTLAVAVLLVFLIGISRIYLGVHYPTDVLGGWSVGLAWASFWLLIDKIFTKEQ
ncbi:phosphatase PAP2 family protein [Desulfopila inferna]|uniref:phosphatase PAP2 family protein n=1 Tax=Desulfopila inferna TaxID=468528 RepID=UPI0019639074|nr:phosphatase PAP2 family protein [Desulfopila inferna]MBM9605016.1 phosphatase PAP2 family protein [Desulfopila inferna]